MVGVPAVDDPSFSSFELGFRGELQRKLAAEANLPVLYVQFTNVGPIGELHASQWWTTGIQVRPCTTLHLNVTREARSVTQEVASRPLNRPPVLARG